MKKTHIRTYMMAETGDIEVTGWRNGDSVDLSGHYQAAEHDRRHAALGTTLDVFRHGDDRLAWALSPTGNDVYSAQTLQLLLGLFVEDVQRPAGDPRLL